MSAILAQSKNTSYDNHVFCRQLGVQCICIYEYTTSILKAFIHISTFFSLHLSFFRSTTLLLCMQTIITYTRFYNNLPTYYTRCTNISPYSIYFEDYEKKLIK